MKRARPGKGNNAKAGLPVGSAVPVFQLETTDGATASLTGLLARGNPLLLVFSDAQCSACRDLAPDLVRWQRDDADRVTVAAVASGGADANRAHAQEVGLRNVLL